MTSRVLPGFHGVQASWGKNFKKDLMVSGRAASSADDETVDQQGEHEDQDDDEDDDDEDVIKADDETVEAPLVIAKSPCSPTFEERERHNATHLA